MSTHDDQVAELDRRNIEAIARISIRLEDPPEVGDPKAREEAVEGIFDTVRYCEDCDEPLKEWEDDLCTMCANK